LDLACEDGRKVAHQLINQADVLIENFRPGKMEDWGLGPDEFQSSNPKLIYTRVSGYGQTGPYASMPGFASVCEGVAGMRYVNGFPGQAPVRANLSLGDTFAGMHAVKPSGTTVTGIVPTNTYACADKKYIVIGGNGDSIFKRLMNAIGRQDMAEDKGLANNAGRVENENAIDEALGQWASSINSIDALAVLKDAAVPAGPINSVADVVADPHFQARNSFEAIEVDGEQRIVPAVHPKLARTPGATQWPGPKLGEHTSSVLSDWLGVDQESR